MQTLLSALTILVLATVAKGQIDRVSGTIPPLVLVAD